MGMYVFRSKAGLREEKHPIVPSAALVAAMLREELLYMSLIRRDSRHQSSELSWTIHKESIHR